MKETYKDELATLLACQLIEKELKEKGYNVTQWMTGQITDVFNVGVSPKTYYNMINHKAKIESTKKVLDHFGVTCGFYAEYDAEIKKD